MSAYRDEARELVELRERVQRRLGELRSVIEQLELYELVSDSPTDAPAANGAGTWQRPPIPSAPVFKIKKMVGSQIQQGNIASSQALTAQPVAVEATRQWVARVRKVESELGLPADELQDLDAELSTAEAQARSRAPKKSILRASVEGIGSILNSATGKAVALQLTKEIPDLVDKLEKLNPHG